MTVKELKEELNKFPEDWKIGLYLGSDIHLPWNDYPLRSIYGYDEGEVGLNCGPDFIINNEPPNE